MITTWRGLLIRDFLIRIETLKSRDDKYYKKKKKIINKKISADKEKFDHESKAYQIK